ncbi:RluA family pseudouridine synthase [Gilvibacter sediminis]|uniref:RluA family pseudouridine synthase n=1 Tax=Gilvibacter sediminis TaxID=379071 RepID=UPI00234FD1C6|nr:RluA family pseudouridine synthase [Gilvibacter sediminis]MDC7998113.1 RluA family pseudouridine synthase [Gilvibacter sediminis]
MRSTPENIDIIYEDNHLLVVNKRAGDLVQGDQTGDLPLVEIAKEYIARKYNKPGKVFLGVVHRLDRPTSGVVVFARTSKALSRLNAMFQNREPQKTYWAVVEQAPEREQATLTHHMVRNPKQNKSYAHTKEVPQSKKAVLTYRVLARLERYTALEVELHTGRHHQIRSQLAAIGSVIKGDLKYGAKRSNTDGSIHLHAHRLELLHPVKKEPMSFVAVPNTRDAVWAAVIGSGTDRA